MIMAEGEDPRDGLSPARRAQLEQLLLERRRSGRAALPRLARGAPGSCASFAQERLWFLQQLEPESPFYNLTAAVCARGAAGLRALHQGLAELWRRHETLRTVFTVDGGTPRPQVLGVELNRVPWVDVSGLAVADRDATVNHLVRLFGLRPFDLAAAPPVRACLVTVGADEAVVTISMHHVAGDGWSRGVMVRDLAQISAAFLEGLASPLTELAVQYVDYAVWQRRAMRSETAQSEVRYWHEELSGAPELLELPWDRPRPDIQSYRGAKLPFRLDAQQTLRVRELARRHGATLYQVILAAFQVLLSRWSGQEDVCVGTPIAGRVRRELEGLVGMFVNTLVMRAHVAGDDSFAVLLTRTRDQAFRAYGRQTVPFQRLVDELRPQRSLRYSPLFQVMFVLQDARAAELRLPGLSLTPIEIPGDLAQFDLSLDLIEEGDEIGGFLEYNTDLFNGTTVARFSRQLGKLLAAVTARPELRLAEIDLLDADHEAQLQREWNDTQRPLGEVADLLALVARQAATRPDATALVCGEAHLTYAELVSRAYAVGESLRDLGVGVDTLVGLCCDRSLELVEGMLGVLAAGGGYVPLDPSYPRERLRLLVDDARLHLVLATEQTAPLFPLMDARPVLISDLIARGQSPKTAGGEADAVAYVIYTSGSTGRPKGVLVPHRGAVNLCQSFIEDVRLTSADRVLHFAAMTFDVSVEELFAGLAAGATVVLSEGELVAGTSLMALVGDQALTVLNLPTPYWAALTNELAAEGRSVPAAVRLTVIGSDKASLDADRPWRALSSGASEIVNAYGPTECAVEVTRYRVPEDRSVAAGCRLMPIGRPIANTGVRVLDSTGRSAAIGERGALEARGAGLARGYLDRPALTVRGFGCSTDGGVGERVYRTGDAARVLADGTVEFLERTDFQVKIRGFRVELNEIEAQLVSVPGVEAAVVVARPDPTGEQRIVAYVVGAVSVVVLREVLVARLPAYMVPSLFVPIAVLPLTANGKVDRRALPLPESSGEVRRERVAPRTPAEEVLARIWRELLGVEEVGVTDDFFQAGGHSLMVTRLLSRIRSAFGVDLPLKDVYAATTIAGLALLIEELLIDEAARNA